MEIFHTKCRSRLLLDLSQSFVLVSPAISIENDGVSASVVDVVSRGKKSSVANYLCPKCDESFGKKESDEVSGLCSLCGELVPIDNLFSNDYFVAVCPECISAGQGKKSPTNERIRRTKEYYPEGCFEFGNKSLDKLIFNIR